LYAIVILAPGIDLNRDYRHLQSEETRAHEGA
jgi:hypothetical protein